MTAETPLEIEHLAPRLRTDFAGKIAEARSGTPEEREVNFLTRALAAFALHKLAGCTLEEAAQGVVDGGGDGGIDAIHHAPATHILWIVQSKYMKDGRGEPDLGGATKFKTGLDHLLQGRFDTFRDNEAWRAILPRLELIFRDASLQVRVVLVYSGINIMSEDRRLLFEDLKRRFSSDTDYLHVQFCNLTTVYDWLVGADQGAGVEELQFKLYKPGWVRDPYETIYGLLPLDVLAAWYRDHGKKLIVANIRGYCGKTEVNEQILVTARDEPHHFVYLNNGLTAFCSRFEVENVDRANAEEKRIKAHSISIINGAQTLGSVAQCFTQPPEPTPKGFVFLKLISLQKCDDDREFADRITRSTNYQNQIGSRDFASLDEQQERIAKQLLLSGVTYHYKEDADVPRPDATNFTLEEATTACACLAQQTDCDFVTRLLANRRSLWSFEDIAPPGELSRTRYSQVFRADRSARTVWRAVQTQRLVIDYMQTNGRASTGVRKAFYENARWLVLNALFLKLRPEQGDALALTPQEEQDIRRKAEEITVALWEVCETQGFVSRRSTGSASGGDQYEQTRHFKSILSAQADCRQLRSGLLAKLAAQNSGGSP